MDSLHVAAGATESPQPKSHVYVYVCDWFETNVEVQLEEVDAPRNGHREHDTKQQNERQKEAARLGECYQQRWTSDMLLHPKPLWRNNHVESLGKCG